MVDQRLTGWTDERIETLKKLWLAGISASEIAAELGGITRNAVCGKVHRLGLSGKQTRLKPNTADVTTRNRRVPTGGPTASRAERIIEGKRRAEAPVLIVVADSAEAIPLHIAFLSLNEDTCKWAYGDEPSEFTFCGSTPKPGFPYCVAHCRIAYVPAVKRKRSDKKDWHRGTSGIFGRGKAA